MRFENLYRRIIDWEHWPFYFFYLWISYAWVIYYLKSKSLWFFTSSNPTMAFGGFEGEAKSNVYRQLPADLCPESIYIEPHISFDLVLSRLYTSDIQYPFIVKPDIGMKGLLFRKIECEKHLLHYHKNMPVRYIIQELVDLPYEVSIFYCRKPESRQGEITAFIRKDMLEVTGDGVSSLRELIRQTEDAGLFREEITRHNAHIMDKVLERGEVHCLCPVANLFNGSRFRHVSIPQDGTLLRLFDDISHRSHFCYGRYDIKCRSIEEMSKGKGFVILEFNGAGSVPNHIYAGGYKLLGAYREMLKHWRLLYEISVQHKRLGWPFWSFRKGWIFLRNSKKNFRLLKQLDKELNFATTEESFTKTATRHEQNQPPMTL